MTIGTLDPADADFWKRTPQDRADETATFEIAPYRQRFLKHLREYVEEVAENEGLRAHGLRAYSADEAGKALLGYIRDWEGDFVRSEVLEGELVWEDEGYLEAVEQDCLRTEVLTEKAK